MAWQPQEGTGGNMTRGLIRPRSRRHHKDTSIAPEYVVGHQWYEVTDADVQRPWDWGLNWVANAYDPCG